MYLYGWQRWQSHPELSNSRHIEPYRGRTSIVPPLILRNSWGRGRGGRKESKRERERGREATTADFTQKKNGLDPPLCSDWQRGGSKDIYPLLSLSPSLSLPVPLPLLRMRSLFLSLSVPPSFFLPIPSPLWLPFGCIPHVGMAQYRMVLLGNWYRFQYRFCRPYDLCEVSHLCDELVVVLCIAEVL